MKRLLYILPLLLLPMVATSCGKGTNQEETIAENGTSCVTTIQINDSLPAPTQKPILTSRDGTLRALTGYDLTPVICSDLPDSMVCTSHVLINSARYAYASHRPLVLSPDMVWLVIASGFAEHIHMNADSMRQLIVPFEGKQMLTVTIDQFVETMTADELAPSFEQFQNQIVHWTGEELAETMVADFSTTTPASYVTSQIILMSSVRDYFNYSIVALCGIPTIYLEGTERDWLHIIEKIQYFRRFKLGWWVNALEPVLRRIANAAAGEMDVAFWQSIVQQTELPVTGEQMCGIIEDNQEIDGWILTFYPYVGGCRNDFKFLYDTDISALPGEAASVSVEYKWMGQKRQMELLAGLVGFSIDSTNQAIRPEIGWALCDSILDDSSYKYEKRMSFMGTGYPGTPQKYVEQPCPNAIDDGDETIYKRARVEPTFPGGNNEMQKYIQNALANFSVSDQTRKRLSACVEFVVEKDGRLTNATIEFGSGTNAFDQEALRIVNAMPRWIPGQQGGILLRVKHSVWITK